MFIRYCLATMSTFMVSFCSSACAQEQQKVLSELIVGPLLADFRLTDVEKRYVRLKLLGEDAGGELKVDEFENVDRARLSSAIKVLGSNEKMSAWLKERSRLLDDFAYRESLFGQLDEHCLLGLQIVGNADATHVWWTSATVASHKVGKIPLPLFPGASSYVPKSYCLTVGKDTVSRRIDIDVREDWARDICGASAGVATDATGAFLVLRNGYGCCLDLGTAKVLALGKGDFGDIAVAGLHRVESDGKRLNAIVEVLGKEGSTLRGAEFHLDKEVKNDRPLPACRLIYMGKLLLGNEEHLCAMDLSSNRVIMCRGNGVRVVKGASFPESTTQAIKRWVTWERLEGRESPWEEPSDLSELTWDSHLAFLLRDQMRALPLGKSHVMIRAYPDSRGVLVSQVVDFVANDIGVIGSTQRVLDARSVVLGGKVAVFTVEMNEAEKSVQFKSYLVSETGIQERSSWRERVQLSGKLDDIAKVPLFDVAPTATGCRLFQAQRFETNENFLVTEFDHKCDVISNRRSPN